MLSSYDLDSYRKARRAFSLKSYGIFILWIILALAQWIVVAMFTVPNTLHLCREAALHQGAKLSPSLYYQLQIVSTFALVVISWWADVLAFFGLCILLIVIFALIGVILPKKMDLTLDIAVLFILSFIFMVIASFTLIVHLTMAFTVPFAYVVVELAISITILLFVMYHAQTIHGHRFAEMRLNDFLLASIILFHDFLIIYWLTFYWQINYRLVTSDAWIASSSASPNRNASVKFLDDVYMSDWELVTTPGNEFKGWNAKTPGGEATTNHPPGHRPKTDHRFWAVNKRTRYPGRHNNRYPDGRRGYGNDYGHRWDPEDMTPGTEATGKPFDDHHFENYPRRRPSEDMPSFRQMPDSSSPAIDGSFTTRNSFPKPGHGREGIFPIMPNQNAQPKEGKYKIRPNNHYFYRKDSLPFNEEPNQFDLYDPFHRRIEPNESISPYRKDKAQNPQPYEGQGYSELDTDESESPYISEEGLDKENYYDSPKYVQNAYPPIKGLSKSLMKNITRNSLINPDDNVPIGDVEIIDPSELAFKAAVSSKKGSEELLSDSPGREPQDDGDKPDIYQIREPLTTNHYPTGLPDFEKLVLNVSSSMLK
ncbi:uncharacterized protein [Drosophila bipectinata]|uniref:uncharacterized protein isoform X2 n=1 Tax=Drosophila bipectinata TaxID=42026 RepID=UPI0038B3AFBB